MIGRSDQDKERQEGQQSGMQGHEEPRGEAAARPAVSAANVAHYFKGLDLPCTKQDLLRHAGRNNAPEEVLREIQNMPDSSSRPCRRS